MAISPEQQNSILQVTSTLPGLKLVYLFGSRARKQSGNQSDWDVAILTERKIASVKCWELAQEIALKLDANVDLVDLSKASTVFRLQVVSDGILLYGTEQDADLFAMQTYSMYGSLQEARQGILEDFVKELKNE